MCVFWGEKKLQKNTISCYKNIQIFVFLFYVYSQSEIKLMTFPGKLKIWGLF